MDDYRHPGKHFVRAVLLACEEFQFGADGRPAPKRDRVTRAVTPRYDHFAHHLDRWAQRRGVDRHHPPRHPHLRYS